MNANLFQNPNHIVSNFVHGFDEWWWNMCCWCNGFCQFYDTFVGGGRNRFVVHGYAPFQGERRTKCFQLAQNQLIFPTRNDMTQMGRIFKINFWCGKLKIYFKCQVCGKIEIGRINFQLPRHATKTLGDVFNPRNILNELVSKQYLDVLGAQTMILLNLQDNTISMLVIIEQKNKHSYWHQVKKYPNRSSFCHVVTRLSWFILVYRIGLLFIMSFQREFEIMWSFFFF